jgi:hypothetical protein
VFYYEHSHDPSIAKILGNGADFDGPVTDPHAKKSFRFYWFTFRLSYYMIDYTNGIQRLFPKKAFKSVVDI